MEYQCNIKEFFNKNKKTKTNIYIIFALDILGFSNYIMDYYNDSRANENMYKLLHSIHILNNHHTCESAVFSDSIFMFLKVNFEENLFLKFESMLYDLEHIIESAMQDGILIRGGMCVGECVIDMEKNIFYGPGIIKAHYMEEKLAHEARIIVDTYDYDQLIALFKYTSSHFNENEILFLKDDEYYSFDFIEAMFKFTGMNTDMNECMRRYKYWINICRNKIIKSSGSNLQKYLSKLDYHINSYKRIQSQYSPDCIPNDIANLFD